MKPKGTCSACADVFHIQTEVEHFIFSDPIKSMVELEMTASSYCGFHSWLHSMLGTRTSFAEYKQIFIRYHVTKPPKAIMKVAMIIEKQGIDWDE